MIHNAAFFSGGGLQRGVRSDPRYEVLTQIGGKVGKTPIAKYLSCTQDRGRVDVKALGHLARGEKAGFVGRVEDGSDQTLTTRVEFLSCFGEARVKGGRGSLTIVTVRGRKSIPDFLTLVGTLH